MAHYLLSNIGGLYSYNGLAGVLGSNENTAREFIAILENSFLIKEIRNYSYSLKQQTKTRKKCYCVDNGLIHAVSFALLENRGRLMENLVYTELVNDDGYRLKLKGLSKPQALKFSWERCASEVLDIYGEVIKRPKLESLRNKTE